MKMRSISKVILVLAMGLVTSGCLGTLVGRPPSKGQVFSTTRAHLLASPTEIRTPCTGGLAHTFTFVPLWGIAVGILTIGIVVPMTTNYSCVASG